MPPTLPSGRQRSMVDATASHGELLRAGPHHPAAGRQPTPRRRISPRGRRSGPEIRAHRPERPRRGANGRSAGAGGHHDRGRRAGGPRQGVAIGAGAGPGRRNRGAGPRACGRPGRRRHRGRLAGQGRQGAAAVRTADRSTAGRQRCRHDDVRVRRCHHRSRRARVPAPGRSARTGPAPAHLLAGGPGAPECAGRRRCQMRPTGAWPRATGAPRRKPGRHGAAPAASSRGRQMIGSIGVDIQGSRAAVCLMEWAGGQVRQGPVGDAAGS